MITKAYAIYDDVAKAFAQPFFVHGHGLAIRLFADQVNSNNENQINMHPENFWLYHIGTYDDQKGELVSLDKPASLGRAKEYKKETELKKEIEVIEDLIEEFRKLVNNETNQREVK